MISGIGSLTLSSSNSCNSSGKLNNSSSSKLASFEVAIGNNKYGKILTSKFSSINSSCDVISNKEFLIVEATPSLLILESYFSVNTKILEIGTTPS
ncbi:hypothetical protein WICMUC_001846 [Wickerhamomyces mucosus]|uniref:Uncharacterized protein n=1 Tax=Wickerhamomyces mucosus TaxID=1378264 RepID=A0A9P8TG30_9ASCO|nr:hypothetical protein WICMUC_001846 [Wickerhamomyces mucosus]